MSLTLGSNESNALERKKYCMSFTLASNESNALERNFHFNCEQDIDVEIIDGFYYQNIAFINDKVRLFAEFWMRIYSNCCLQRGYAMELLNDNKPEDVKVIIHSFPTT